MKLNFTTLLYFQKTAELQHMTNAAKELHIAQPALSRSIRGLEDELGVTLFEHYGRNIKLTKNGEILLKYSKNFLRDLESLQRELSESQNLQQMTVRLVILSASKSIPVFLMKFKQEHPKALLEVVQPNNRGIINQKQMDLTLFSSVEPIDDNHTVTLFKENLVMIVNNSDPHANLTNAKLSDFSDANFIAAPKGMGLRSATDTFCKEAGFIPKIVMESDSPDTVREFVHAGLGIALVPEITWNSAIGDEILVIKIESPKCHRYLNLSWKADTKLSLVAVLLREYIIDHFSEFVKKSAQQNLYKYDI